MPVLVGTFHSILRGALATAVAVAVLLTGAPSVHAQDETEDLGQLWTPAELETALRLPGEGDQIRRPSALFMDHRHGELYVADPAADRIVVFDREGFYRFEFDGAGRLASFRGLVVDSEGLIYVLGSSQDGDRIVRFDFDGMVLEDFPLPVALVSSTASLTIDEHDDLYLLDASGNVTVVDREARTVREFSVQASLTSEVSRRELILGSPKVSRGEFFVPAATLGTVLVFDAQEGTHLRDIGVPGGNATEFAFPVAVDVTPSGLVAVLDKMRFVVVFLTLEGRALGEFGGKGYRDGWFYHPSLMVASDEDHVIVGQVMDGRIQVCRVPGFVRSRLVRDRASHRAVEVGTSGAPASTTAQPLALETVQEAVVE